MRDGPLLAANWLLFAALILACARACAEGWTIRPVAVQNADGIEWNFAYDSRGKLFLEQLCFREWDGEYHQIVAWRLRRCAMAIGPDYVVWLDGDILRVVRGRVYKTWYVGDVEMRERRSHLPQCKRKGLLKCTPAYHWR